MKITRPGRYLSWIITIPLAIVIVSFAMSNRDPAGLSLWPLPFVVDVPIYLAVLGALAIGFVGGGIVMWWSSGRSRRLARRQRTRLAGLTAEVESLRVRQAEVEEAATRVREEERLNAAAKAAESSAQREEARAPRRLAALDAP